MGRQKPTTFCSKQAGPTVVPGPWRCTAGLLGSTPLPFSKGCLSLSSLLLLQGPLVFLVLVGQVPSKRPGSPLPLLKEPMKEQKFGSLLFPYPQAPPPDSLGLAYVQLEMNLQRAGRLCITTKDGPKSAPRFGSLNPSQAHSGYSVTEVNGSFKRPS